MKKTLYLVVAALVLVACNKEKESVPTAKDVLANDVQINIVDFVDADATKGSVNSDGVFSWSTSDRIGVWPLTVDPEQDPQQLYFDWSSGGDTGASATFSGSGWGMFCTGEFSYASYFPYVNDGSKTAVPFTYPANLDESNDNIAAVRKYLPMYSLAITPNAPVECKFTYYQLSALARFVLTAPKGVQYTKVVIKTSDDSNVFTTAGTYDLTTATALAAPTITSITQTNAIGFSTNATLSDGTPALVLWMTMCPADLAGKTLNISMWDSSNKKYEGSVTCTKNQQSGKRYKYAVTLSESVVNPYDPSFVAGIEGVDLGHPTYLFAPFNLGATSMEETGDFFAWGETDTKASFTSVNYTGSSAVLTDLILTSDYDAAAQKWGNGWIMPAYSLNGFLQDGCDKEWVTINGTQGWKMYNKSDHTKWIFMPAGGIKDGDDVLNSYQGYYWTSTEYNSSYGLNFIVNSTSPKNFGGLNPKWKGLVIRAVKPKS